MLNPTSINELDNLLQMQHLQLPKRKKSTKEFNGFAQLPPTIISEINSLPIERPVIDNTPLLNLIEEFCKSHHLSISEFRQKADLSKQCMNNITNLKVPKQPSRNTLLSILFALELPHNEINKAMDYYGYRFSQKNSRDNILIYIHEYMINNPPYSVKDINEYLLERGAQMLSQNSFKYE